MNQSTILDYSDWRHRIRFSGEYVTPGTHPIIWDEIGLPKNMDNLSYFEAGAYDGGYAFEAENRGADKIMATDVWELQNFDGSEYSHNPSREGFDLMHQYLNSSVDSMSIDIVDVSPRTVGEYNIVNCMNVISWTNFPVYILKNLASITKDSLYLTLALKKEEGPIPNLSMYSKPANNDYRERWILNKAAMDYILHEYCGFDKVEFERLNYFSYRSFGLIGTGGYLYSNWDCTECSGILSRGTIVETLSDMESVIYLKELRGNQSGWAKKSEINLIFNNNKNLFSQSIKTVKNFKDSQKNIYNRFMKFLKIRDGPIDQLGYVVKAKK